MHILSFLITALCLFSDGYQMEAADLLFSAALIQKAVCITTALSNSRALQVNKHIMYSSRIPVQSLHTNSNQFCALTLQVKDAH